MGFSRSTFLFFSFFFNLAPNPASCHSSSWPQMHKKKEGMTGQEAAEFPSGVGELVHSAALSQAGSTETPAFVIYDPNAADGGLGKKKKMPLRWDHGRERKQAGGLAALARFPPSHSS